MTHEDFYRKIRWEVPAKVRKCVDRWDNELTPTITTTPVDIQEARKAVFRGVGNAYCSTAQYYKVPGIKTFFYISSLLDEAKEEGGEDDPIGREVRECAIDLFWALAPTTRRRYWHSPEEFSLNPELIFGEEQYVEEDRLF